VYIGKYSDQEKEEAYGKYASLFEVKVPTRHRTIDDPFLLRIAMELYQGNSLPEVLDEPDLLGKSILLKITRARDLGGYCAPEQLSQLADQMFSEDAPLRQSKAMQRWRLPEIQEPPRGLFEAALLAQMCDEQGLPSLDFYYGRERDFAVACWARNWPRILDTGQETIVSEFSLASKTQVGIGALQWFLKQSKYEKYLRIGLEYLSEYESPSIRQALLSSLWVVYNRNREEGDWLEMNEDWLQDVMYKGIEDPDVLVKVEAVKLLAIHTEESEDLIEKFADDTIERGKLLDLVLNLLNVDEEYPFATQSVSFFVLDILERLHQNLGGQYDYDSEIETVLEYIAKRYPTPLRGAAIKALGYIAPSAFLTQLSRKLRSNKALFPVENLKEYSEGVALAVQVLDELYYGSPMCPSYLSELYKDSERLCREYADLYEACAPVIATYFPNESGKTLLRLLKDLQPEQGLLIEKGLPDADKIIQDHDSLMLLPPGYEQLSLPFEELEE
jgi:hypothetical protein